MVKQILTKRLLLGLAVLSVPVAYQNCSRPVSVVQTSTSASTATPTTTGTGTDGGGSTKAAVPGSISVPTASGVVAKIVNGLQGNVSSTAGNFAKALAQVKGNLPQATDPTKATGFDQVQLLVYAACSDLTTGSPSKMQSIYKIDPSKAIADNKDALVSAGVTMVDQYVAGLASQGPTSSQVSSALGNVVDNVAQNSPDPEKTAKVAFMSVCIAANTAGTTLLGF